MSTNQSVICELPTKPGTPHVQIPKTHWEERQEKRDAKIYLRELIINEHYEDWEQVLTSKPYCLSIRRNNGTNKDLDSLVLFKYGPDSDMGNPIVQEARGIILDSENDFYPVCYPFHKFFNIHEQYAHKIHWDSAVVQEKIDGSLIKLYYYKGKWRWATNGTIDAHAAPLSPNLSGHKTFGDVIDSIIDVNNFTWTDFIAKDHTFMFELTSRFNRVVVPHTESRLWCLGARDIRCREEHDIGNLKKLFSNSVSIPETYKLSTPEEIIKAAEALPFDHEGYVVKDKYNNRVKIKSPAYLRVHRLRGDSALSLKRIMTIFEAGEHPEYLSYFPEDKKDFFRFEKAYESILHKMDISIDKYKEKTFADRKELALWAKTQFMPNYIFQYADRKTISALSYFKGLHEKSKISWLEEMLGKVHD